MWRCLRQYIILSDRIDNNPDTILKRLQIFKKNNTSVIEHLQECKSVYQVSEEAKFS